MRQWSHRFCLALALLCVLRGSTGAAVMSFRGTPFAEETLSVSTTAIGITAGLCMVGASQAKVVLQVKDNGIFFTVHAATATPDSGDYAAAVGDIIELEQPSRFRAVRSGVTDALVKVTCMQ